MTEILPAEDPATDAPGVDEASSTDSLGQGPREFGSGPTAKELTGEVTPMATPAACGGSLAWSSTQNDGPPGTSLWKLMQCWATLNGYTGPIDGVTGTNSWKGVQKGLYYDRCTIPPTGIQDAYTNMALQRLASNFCYDGQIDGVMGPNSWKGVAGYVNRYANVPTRRRSAEWKQ